MSVARGAIVPTAVERAQTAFLTGAERGTYCAAVDENFQNLMQELGEAINDLCAKYGKPQPYTGKE